MKFLKYEFTDEQWATIRPTLYSEDEEGNETLIPALNSQSLRLVTFVEHLMRKANAQI
jgi:hypothetical protein